MSFLKIIFLIGVAASFLAISWQRLRRSQSRITLQEEYDFVLVGGGAAGCVLASRLSENSNLSVLLLEAGGDDYEAGLLINVPMTAPSNFLDTSVYWQDLSDEQKYAAKALKNFRATHPHGKLLGGSTAVNFMIYARGNPQDYDDWQSGGAEGWSWFDVEPYFRKLENYLTPLSDGMGTQGPINVELSKPYHSIADYIINSTKELNVPFIDNYNSADMLGTAWTQSTIRRGKRVSAYHAYLQPVLHRSNLHILTHAHVTQILTEGLTATGVKFHQAGQWRTVRAKQEVILSSGTYNSPHLLMLSGIGPAEQLSKHNIDVVLDLPGVGQNLHDHAAISDTIYIADNTTGISLSMGDFTPSNILNYLLYGKGVLAGNPIPVMSFLKSDGNSLTAERGVGKSASVPDVQMMFTSAVIGGFDPAGMMEKLYDIVNMNDDTVRLYYRNSAQPTGTVVAVAVSHPKSRGNISLSSSDPFQRPIISTNLLNHPDDRELMKQGVRFLHKMTMTPTMSSVGAYLVDVKNPSRERFCSQYEPLTDEHLDCYVTYLSGTVFHGVGTCKMGNDGMAVVDKQLSVRYLYQENHKYMHTRGNQLVMVSSELRVNDWLPSQNFTMENYGNFRVRGMKKLRVVDASIIPKITSANTQAPTFMIAERASQFILSDVVQSPNTDEHSAS